MKIKTYNRAKSFSEIYESNGEFFRIRLGYNSGATSSVCLLGPFDTAEVAAVHYLCAYCRSAITTIFQQDCGEKAICTECLLDKCIADTSAALALIKAAKP